MSINRIKQIQHGKFNNLINFVSSKTFREIHFRNIGSVKVFLFVYDFSLPSTLKQFTFVCKFWTLE